MVYSKCKYWKLAHNTMVCKNCMYPNKLYCKTKFYNAENVNQKLEWLEEAIEILEDDLAQANMELESIGEPLDWSDLD